MGDVIKSKKVLESASPFVFYTSSFPEPGGFRHALVEFCNGGLGASRNGPEGWRGQSVHRFLQSIFRDVNQLDFFLGQLEREGRVPEFEVAVKEGFFSVGWCQVSAKIIPMGHDEYYLQGFFFGLQRVKQQEQVLQEENKMLETILGGIGDAVCVYDRECNIIFQNPLHRKWFADPFPYMYFKRHGAGGAALKQGAADTFVETLRDGERNLHSLEITSYPLRNEAGEVFAGINVVRDRSPSTSLAAGPRETAPSRKEYSRSAALASILGESPAIKAVLQAMEKISQLDTVVFIQGETGTGKELVARGIQALSRRSRRPFVTINCGALTETLLDSELFGHKKGAFTGATTEKTGLFEAADGGTIFLDEIGEMSMGTQVKLLRVLQDGEVRKLGSTVSRKVDVRVITATHRDIQRLVAEKKFREDLFYRIHVFTILTPPLKERGEDILLLAHHFLDSFARRQNKAVRGISPEAAEVLMNHPWPGNVRELQNVIERSTILCDTGTLQVGDLPHSLFRPAPPPREPAADADNETLDDVYKKKILSSLNKNRWNKTRTAKHSPPRTSTSPAPLSGGKSRTCPSRPTDSPRPSRPTFSFANYCKNVIIQRFNHPIPADDAKNRGLSRHLRSGDQRASGYHAAGGEAFRPPDRRRGAQSQEEPDVSHRNAGPVHRRRHWQPRQRGGSAVRQPADPVYPDAEGLRHHQGVAGRQRFRVRTADGPHEPQPR